MNDSSNVKSKVLICPYCGDTQPAAERCRACSGLFEPLSRQASHNAMGPWFIRDERRPFQPGASYETIVKLVERNQITRYSILRGPTTRQFWTVARRAPGIAHLLGYCHNCDAPVAKEDHGCPVCGVPFGAYLDRNYLGLPEVKPLPWEPAVSDETRARKSAPWPDAPDFRRAAEPLGLSSFASDDELRGMAARSPYQAPAAGSMGVANPGSVAAGSAGSAGAVVGGNGNPIVPHAEDGLTQNMPYGAKFSPGSDSLTDQSRAGLDATANPSAALATRSMQRRLQEQQRSIRLLMIAMGIVLVASCIVIAMLLNSRRSSGDAAHDVPRSTSDGATPGSNPPDHTHDPQRLGTNGTASDASPSLPDVPLKDDAGPTTMPDDELASPAPGDIDFASEHERAATLLAQARDEQRPLKARIKDAEDATAILKSLKAQSDDADEIAALDKEIADAERLVERLKLQEFFP